MRISLKASFFVLTKHASFQVTIAPSWISLDDESTPVLPLSPH